MKASLIARRLASDDMYLYHRCVVTVLSQKPDASFITFSNHIHPKIVDVATCSALRTLDVQFGLLEGLGHWFESVSVCLQLAKLVLFFFFLLHLLRVLAEPPPYIMVLTIVQLANPENPALGGRVLGGGDPGPVHRPSPPPGLLVACLYPITLGLRCRVVVASSRIAQ